MPPQSHPSSLTGTPSPVPCRGGSPSRGGSVPRPLPAARALRRSAVSWGTGGHGPPRCHTTVTSRHPRGDPQSPRCHTRGCHSMDTQRDPQGSLCQVCGDTGVGRGSPRNRPGGWLEGPGGLTCVQMWCRLGQVLAGFWGSHLGTDVAQTKEGEFGVGYLGLGGLGGVSPGPSPGAGQAGGSWGLFGGLM